MGVDPGKKMTQSKSQIKGSKGSVGGYPPHIYHCIFWHYVGQYVGPPRNIIRGILW